MFTILNANANHIPLTDKSVQCVVTSPPYWGLRDYGTATWVGGDEGCDHVQRIMKPSPKSTLEDHGDNGRSPYLDSLAGIPFKDDCGKCGATRIDSQIGLEPTPEAYVAKIVAVFAEVWRVLRDDGTVFLNLGDSYSGSWGNYHPNSPPGKHGQRLKETARWNRPAYSSQDFLPPTANCGLKPKDLVGIPWRVAFALQSAGWYLRSDIIWSKPNPMPESVTDRPTKAHEYIFLLTKRERYYFDQDAVREDSIDPESFNGRNKRFTANIVNHDAGYDGHRTKVGLLKLDGQTYPTRNIRTVWEIATQPYPEAHFATFPEEIALRCIKAGTSEKGACAECGAPWARVTEKIFKGDGNPYNYEDRATVGNKMKLSGPQLAEWKFQNPDKFLGFQPTCKHDGIDRTIINSPTGTRSDESDPSLITGRAGMNRPRGENEGQRLITRYEQQQYAKQLAQSKYRKQMESEAGQSFAHYIRTDESGARPVPDELLEVWIDRGWLNRVVVPESNSAPTVPCIVLDPFSGAGTVPLVADKLNRRGIGLELKWDYVRMAHDRCYDDAPLLAAMDG